MAHVVNALATLGSFPFRDAAGVLVTGEVNGDFTKRVFKDGSVSAVVATVTEVATLSGYYSTSLTPTGTGSWTVVIEWTDDPTFAWEETFEVVTAAQADPAAALLPIASAASVVLEDGTNFTIKQGNTVIFDYVMTRLGAPQDLTGYVVWFTIKTSQALEDVDATITHSWSETEEGSSVGITRTDPETLVVAPVESGLLYNELTPLETADLQPGSSYYYDVKIETPLGKVRTLESGTIDVEPAITQRITFP